MEFKLHSQYDPKGDQPEAIEQLVKGVESEEEHQVLLGVTGSGKTFTMANVVKELNRPTLVLTHNKTLTAQLYGEFQQFFPENAVEYFVSYYDYYQPEAYNPTTDTYIEKDLSINEEIERLRLRATSSLLSGRRDVLIVASVSCIYGMGNPETFKRSTVSLEKGEEVTRNKLLFKLVEGLYARNKSSLERGTFRVSGDVLDIYPPYAEFAYRVNFWGDEIEELESIDPQTGEQIEQRESVMIFPANLFVTPPDVQELAVKEIEEDLYQQINYFNSLGYHIESKRLEERVNYDLEMIKELGYCSGIENYSRYFDRRERGDRPFCLLDYFPEDYLMFIDESHVTIPQVRGMYSGDRARKNTLVEHGFRLPAALDNRPLNLQEFESLTNQVVYVSATPTEYELQKTSGAFVEQVVRPTGLLDPKIEIRPVQNQVDDLMDEIDRRAKEGERTLVTTLTKRMSEELTQYLTDYGVKCKYLHSSIDTIERVEILRDLRLGNFDVLIGINLLREGLDLPEVAVVAILDADKEGFLRSETSLTQTAGRAARNVNGRVIMYADHITASMQKTMNETDRRRGKQIEYNEKHGIEPETIKRSHEQILQQTSVADNRLKPADPYLDEEQEEKSKVADPVVGYMSQKQLETTIKETKDKMLKAAQNMEFVEAARLRDEMYSYQEKLKEKFGVEYEQAK